MSAATSLTPAQAGRLDKHLRAVVRYGDETLTRRELYARFTYRHALMKWNGDCTAKVVAKYLIGGAGGVVEVPKLYFDTCGLPFEDEVAP